MSLKKLIALSVSLVILMLTFVGCGATSAEDVINSVTMPTTYSIEYEIESEGIIKTMKKTVDEEGNIYFLSNETEVLFIKKGSNYSLYERNEEGVFSESNKTQSYNLSYINEYTSEFTEYAEYTKKQFLPTAKNKGTVTYADRECVVYEINVGFSGTGVTYEIYSDSSTGICMYYNSHMSAFGINLPSDDISFKCTSFETKNIDLLTSII